MVSTQIEKLLREAKALSPEEFEYFLVALQKLAPQRKTQSHDFAGSLSEEEANAYKQTVNEAFGNIEGDWK